MNTLIQQITAAKDALELLERARPILERLGVQIIMPQDETKQTTIYPNVVIDEYIYAEKDIYTPNPEEKERIGIISKLINSSPTNEVSAKKLSFELGISHQAAKIWVTRRIDRPGFPFTYGSSDSSFKFR